LRKAGKSYESIKDDLALSKHPSSSTAYLNRLGWSKELKWVAALNGKMIDIEEVALKCWLMRKRVNIDALLESSKSDYGFFIGRDNEISKDGKKGMFAWHH
jgi:hypothetical protein